MTIERTVGVAGDYATWTAALASLPAWPVQWVDDYVFTQISDVTEVDTVTFSQGDLAGHTLTLQSALDPKGNPNSGFETKFSGAGLIGFYIPYIDIINGTITLKNLYLKAYKTMSHMFAILERIGLAGVNYVVDGCLFDGNGNMSSSTLSNAIRDQQSRHNILVIRSKFWETGRGISITASGSKLTMENCDVYLDRDDFGIAVSPGVTANLRNVFVNKITYSPSATGIIENCAVVSSISPGLAVESNNLTGIIPADEFESLDDTNHRFLFLKTGSKSLDIDAVPRSGPAPLPVHFTTDGLIYTPSAPNLADSGTVPTLLTEDIAGNGIPDEGGNYPIGCHASEYV